MKAEKRERGQRISSLCRSCVGGAARWGSKTKKIKEKGRKKRSGTLIHFLL